MTKKARMAAWAAGKAEGVRRQIQALPKATNGREAQDKAQVISLLHARERRLRRLIPDDDWTPPF